MVPRHLLSHWQPCVFSVGPSYCEHLITASDLFHRIYAVADALSRLPLPSTFNEEDAFCRVEERLVHSLPITHKEINHAFKMGDETLFKKGYENLKSNYQPITVLVAFNNVFERILFMQLCDYFQDNLSPYPRIASIIASRLRFYVYLRNKPFNSQR